MVSDGGQGTASLRNWCMVWELEKKPGKRMQGRVCVAEEQHVPKSQVERAAVFRNGPANVWVQQGENGTEWAWRDSPWKPL